MSLNVIVPQGLAEAFGDKPRKATVAQMRTAIMFGRRIEIDNGGRGYLYGGELYVIDLGEPVP